MWYHDLAVNYTLENVSLTLGINNLTDESPPIVDNTIGAPNNNGAVAGTGYYFFGRSAYLNAKITF
jgi:iron complex outermembrane receptor protein